MAAPVSPAGAGSTAWMRQALRLARAAGRRGEVPVGALAVRDGRVIAAASNRMERAADATAHAEMLVLRRASRVLGGWRLDGVTMVVTLEPCPMCAAAMVLARIDRCVYGARDQKKGADGSVYDVLRHLRANHRVAVEEGVLAGECGRLLSDFFAALRRDRRGPPAGAGSPAGDGSAAADSRRDAGTRTAVRQRGAAAAERRGGEGGGKDGQDDASHDGSPREVMPLLPERVAPRIRPGGDA
jgi:tRNA(adenine34) deaminase